MIFQEIITLGERQYRKTYTDDEKKMLHKLGTDEIYGEAIDLPDSPFEYEEIDNPYEENDEIIDENVDE